MNPRGLDIGGQAVIEGVLMKNRERLAIAVRLPSGQIKIKKEHIPSFPRILRLPIIRGVVTIFHITVIGLRALTWSANQALGEKEELGTIELLGVIGVSLLFGLGLFFAIPFGLAYIIPVHPGLFNVIEGILRLGIFVCYIYLISFFSDVKRLFQYHGAEHMAVNCYEYGQPLTVEHVQKYSTIHPRCGTSFIVLVLIISIVLFSFISTTIWYEQLLYRFLLIPVVAGVSFEVLRLAGRFRRGWLMSVVSAPGMWIQKITTQKPTKRMVEVAIASLHAVIKQR